jgi:FLVCR family feline leukemia virus subgroup C receptor-related protein
MFKNYDPKVDDGKKLTFNLMFVEFCSNVLLLPAFFILKTSPKTPPSAFANTDSAVAFMQAIKALFKNKSFILLFISNSIYFGSLKGLGVVIPYILEPFGFSTG